MENRESQTGENLSRLSKVRSSGPPAKRRTQAERNAEISSTTPMDEYCNVRSRTEVLSAGLDPEDCAPQSMPDASPIKWHLAHTTWFFETFVLQSHSPGYKPLPSAIRLPLQLLLQRRGRNGMRDRNGAYSHGRR